MGATYLSDAFASLAQSAAVLESLRFERTAVLPRTVLSSEDFFETHLIRDAAPHELALFEPNAPSSDVLPLDADEAARLALTGQAVREPWMATKRKGPRRAGGAKDRPSPLKERRATQAPAGTDPDRCLRAATRLLDVYTMPRAQDHVDALKSQYAGLVETINSLEEALRRPPSRNAPQPQHDASYFRQLELEDAIKREQLEIFALEQLKADKEAEAATLAPSARPTASAAPGRRIPSVVARARVGSASAARAPRTSIPASSAPDASSAPSSPSPLANPSRVPAQQHLQNEQHALASPARRPIGARARASLAGAAAGRPSVGQRLSFGSARAGRQSIGGGGSGSAEDLAIIGQKAKEDGETTPKPVRRTAPRSSLGKPAASPSAAKSSPLAPPIPVIKSPAASPAKPTAATKPKARVASLPQGVTPAELKSAAKSVWGTLGDANALKAWGKKWAREQEDGADEREKRVAEGTAGWEETLAVLRYALANSTNSTDGTPGSPSSQSITSFSTSTTGGADGEGAAPPWTPAQQVEAQLCVLLLSTFSGSTPSAPASPSKAALPPLTIILRDSVLAAAASSPSRPAGGKTPHLSMAALKAHLGAFARAKGWTEEMGTTAVYALVGKSTVKIDRRGREGAAVGFKPVDV
ncbi:uncharacterized protein JCM10292_006356 [Rhodotorula paludigena]|uniref:uncharacterized protein n=1 Tax=Rhodotorula paludigena TaxID=86838 RepID=UPI003177A39E